jgi:hypothetical protein
MGALLCVEKKAQDSPTTKFTRIDQGNLLRLVLFVAAIILFYKCVARRKRTAGDTFLLHEIDWMLACCSLGFYLVCVLVFF